MRRLHTPPPALLALVLALCRISALNAAEEPRLEPVIVNGETVVLHVEKLADAGNGLPGVQEYSLQVSENLSEWEELTRTDLMADLEVPDFEGRGREARFYRLIGLPVSEAVRVFAEAFSAEVEELTEFASGIARDGVTLSDYREMRSALAAVELEIIALIESGVAVPESLLTLYRERLGGIDGILASNPLRVDWEGRSYEIEVSKAMQVLNEEYRRLGRVSLSDYDRLPGVDAVDLVGHEDLRSYLNSRVAGRSAALPVFDTLSPFGNYTLVHTLVLKHMDVLSETETDDDLDGAFELDYQTFRRLLNGSERALREGRQIVEALREGREVATAELTAPNLEADVLADVLRRIDAYLETLDKSLRENVKEKTFEPVFQTQLLGEASQLYHEEEHSYYEVLSSALWHPNRALTLFSEYEGPMPDSPATELGLLEVKDAVASWGEELAAGIVAFLEPLELTRSWRERVESVLLAKLNGYSFNGHRADGYYELVFKQLESAAVYGEVALDVDGVGVVMIDGSHDVWRSFPSSRRELLELESVASAVSEEALAGFSLRSDWAALRLVRLRWDPYPESDELSEFGVRVQLMSALLSAYADQAIGENGELRESALARIAAFSAELREVLAKGELAADEGIAALEAIAFEAGDSLSPDEFEAVLEIVEATASQLTALREEAVAALTFGRLQLFDFLMEEQNERLFGRLRELTGLGADTLWLTSIRLEIGGRDHFVNPHWLRHTLALAGQRVGVLHEHDARLSRRQLARFNGVSEEDARALDRTMDWGSLTRYPIYRALSSTVSYDRAPQDYETYFVFIPRLLETYGSDILGESGEIERNLVEAALLAGLVPAVERGTSIFAKASEIVNKRCANAERQIGRLDYSEWSAWEESEDYFVNAIKAIAEEASPLVSGLSPRELGRLASQLDSGTQSSPYSLTRALNRRGDVDEVALRFENGESWILDLKQLSGSIQMWHRPPEYTLDLSRSGLTESDLAASRELRRDLVFSESGEVDPDSLYYDDEYDRNKLLVAALRRLHDDPDSAPQLYRESLVKDGKVVLETFRRYVNRIDRTHNELVALAREASQTLRRELDALLAEPVSLEAIEQAYDKLRDLKTKLTASLDDRRSSFSAGDLTEAAEQMTKAHQNAFARLMDALNYSPLWLTLDGELVKIPYGETSRALLDELRKRFPGESIAAHHFARFYGLSVADLRAYDKLEQFLGSQIVALPSEGQTVQVVSKLSDIGMRQLVADLLRRHAAELYETESGTLDLDLLVKRISNEALGLDRTLALANTLFDDAMDELAALGPVKTAEDLEGMSRLLIEARESIERRLLDAVSALSEESLEATQALVDERYQEMRSVVHETVFGKPLQIPQIDGGTVSLTISEYEDEIAAKLTELTRKYEGVQEGELQEAERLVGWVFPGDDWAVEGRFSSDDTPTRLGLHVLVSRLVAAYGGSVVVEGAFDLEAFLVELEKDDSSRGRALIERLEASEEAKWNEVLPAYRGPITPAEARALSDRFDASYAAYSTLYRRLSSASAGGLAPAFFREDLNRAWRNRVDRYEAELYERSIRLERGGVAVVLETDELLKKLYSIYEDGAKRLLDSYALGGESGSQYEEKRSLFRYYLLSLTSRVEPMAGFGNIGESWRYGFDLGGLHRLPGIIGEDLEGLDVASEDRVAVVQVEPELLLVGDLDLRTLAPGSGVQVGVRDQFASNGWQDGWLIYDPRPAHRYSELSWRAKQTRVLIPLILEYWERLVTDAGTLDWEAVEALLWEAQESGS